MPDCLGCQRCESGPVVTLHDGRVVCNYCPDYRAECEARHVLSLPSIDARRKYLSVVGQKRGQDAALELGELVRVIWKAGRV